MGDEDVGALISMLRDFRARSEACKRLVLVGQEVVGPLMDALSAESQEGARWAIIKCLGDLRATEAAGALIPLLESSDYGTAAHKALVGIAGQDLGPAPESWKRWLETSGTQTPKAGLGTEKQAEMISPERLMELSLIDAEATYRKTGEDAYRVELSLEEGKRQDVSVAFNLTDHEGSPIVIVYSDCGPAQPEHYETALRRNLKMPYGALAIRDRGGVPYLVMFNTLLHEALSPRELCKSITIVGERAERVREELSGLDG